MTVFTFKVDIEDSGIAYFKDSPVRMSDQFINRAESRAHRRAGSLSTPRLRVAR
jgi:hypothetical protein